VPYVFFLLTGIAVWTFFSEALTAATNVFQEYSFLVKKVQFQIAVLPLVKILSALAVHVVLMVIVMAILLARGVPVSWCWLQVPYYLLALLVLLQGLAWITASLNVFARDIGHIVGILLQFGFWLTPVFWRLDMVPGLVPAAYQRYVLVLLKLNPLAYIVEGYRGSLLTAAPLWRDYWWGLYFWVAALALLALGAVLFRKLKPHFADVL
jgi:lipopolysaccharide transport system permease protein/teichoic acid transport system permease protein